MGGFLLLRFDDPEKWLAVPDGEYGRLTVRDDGPHKAFIWMHPVGFGNCAGECFQVRKRDGCITYARAYVTWWARWSTEFREKEPGDAELADAFRQLVNRKLFRALDPSRTFSDVEDVFAEPAMVVAFGAAAALVLAVIGAAAGVF